MRLLWMGSTIGVENTGILLVIWYVQNSEDDEDDEHDDVDVDDDEHDDDGNNEAPDIEPRVEANTIVGKVFNDTIDNFDFDDTAVADKSI